MAAASAAPRGAGFGAEAETAAGGEEVEAASLVAAAAEAAAAAEEAEEEAEEEAAEEEDADGPCCSLLEGEEGADGAEEEGAEDAPEPAPTEPKSSPFLLGAILNSSASASTIASPSPGAAPKARATM